MEVISGVNKEPDLIESGSLFENFIFKLNNGILMDLLKGIEIR